MAFGFIKNFHIWPSYGQKMARIPILGHTFFGYNSAISWLIGQKIFMGIPSYDAYFSVLIFWPLSAGKLAWPPRALLMAWGLQIRQKVGPLGGTFGPTTISKSCNRNFQQSAQRYEFGVLLQ